MSVLPATLGLSKDMGKLMAWLKPKVAGKTDMGKLSGLIKAQLG